MCPFDKITLVEVCDSSWGKKSFLRYRANQANDYSHFISHVAHEEICLL